MSLVNLMWSWQLGSIRGIAVKVHATFPLVLLWSAAQFGAGRGEDAGRLALYGVVLALALFGCVLLHEIGHALVALRLGVPVTEIVLLPIGGLAKLRMLRDDPKEEFLIAAAGPLVNIAIALILLPLLWLLFSHQYADILPNLIGPLEDRSRGLLYLLARSLQRPSLTGAAAYLFLANVLLCLFNLLPAFPMDGGRLLRAMLAVLLPYRWATIVAVRLGQGVALALAVWALRTGLDWGLLLVAGFIFFGGGSELQRVALREVLTRGRVGTAMRRAFHPLPPEWSLHAARLLARQTGQLAFPVMEGNDLQGLLTLNEMQQASPGRTVGEAMVHPFAILPPTATLYDAQLALMGRDQFAAAVMDNGALLGLLSLEDIERAYQGLRRPKGVKV